jgi:TonB family protein
MTSERTLDWVDGLVHGLIHHAARRAPDSLSERLEEEWLADLAERCGRISRLRFAVGCCWATSVIAHDHGAAALPATSSPVGHALLGYANADYPPLFSRRTITFLLVAGLHAAVLYGLAIGLTSKFTKVSPPTPFLTRQIEHPRSDLPPPPQPQISHTRIEVPISEMPPIESERGDVVEGTAQVPQRPELSPSVSAPVRRVQGKPDIGFPSAEDFYPPAAIRMGEKGSATVRACVDAKGRLISEPTIVESTGSPRLDEGALKLARAGSGHYRATTEDGQPVNSCYPFRIRFELRN